METIRIQTAQNVEVEYEIASIGDRILAYLLDMLFLISYSIVFLIMSSILSASGFTIVWTILPFLLIISLVFYDLLCEIFVDGQSFGKKLRKIKVVKTDGSQPTLGSYLLRWLLRIVDVGISSGSVALITIAINGRGQRVGDLAAGTTVIKLVQRTKLEDTIFTTVGENYNPTFAEASQLDDHIISVVKEVLNTWLEEDRHGLTRQKLAIRTQKVIEKKLGISSNMDARPFLQTILKDYNHLKGKI